LDSSTILSLENISVYYGDNLILENLSLDIKDKGFLTLLGPSGCGKTTILRVMGGFVKPNSGTIKFNGKIINNIPPNKREVNTVFQRYALFPHLNVYDNIAFGLNIKKVSKNELEERVEHMFDIINLKGYEYRNVASLSGGQQQRVAIARALIKKPKLLLADEPTANLDSITGKQILDLIAQINKKDDITVLFSTHDERVMDISSKIFTMEDGKIIKEV
jgi:spermidine/putrescine transport system ATP-binding protein